MKFISNKKIKSPTIILIRSLLQLVLQKNKIYPYIKLVRFEIQSTGWEWDEKYYILIISTCIDSSLSKLMLTPHHPVIEVALYTFARGWVGPVLYFK